MNIDLCPILLPRKPGPRNEFADFEIVSQGSMRQEIHDSLIQKQKEVHSIEFKATLANIKKEHANEIKQIKKASERELDELRTSLRKAESDKRLAVLDVESDSARTLNPNPNPNPNPNSLPP